MGRAPPGGRSGDCGGPDVNVDSIPATVRTWGEVREVVLDDGCVRRVDPSVPLEGFRALRTGQRVRLRVQGDQIVAVTWPTA